MALRTLFKSSQDRGSQLLRGLSALVFSAVLSACGQPNLAFTLTSTSDPSGSTETDVSTPTGGSTSSSDASGSEIEALLDEDGMLLGSESLLLEDGELGYELTFSDGAEDSEVAVTEERARPRRLANRNLASLTQSTHPKFSVKLAKAPRSLHHERNAKPTSRNPPPSQFIPRVSRDPSVHRPYK